MIGLPAHGFVLLSMPKCVDVAGALAARTAPSWSSGRTRGLKHMNCQSFHALMVPVLRNGAERDDYEPGLAVP